MLNIESIRALYSAPKQNQQQEQESEVIFLKAAEQKPKIKKLSPPSDTTVKKIVFEIKLSKTLDKDIGMQGLLHNTGISKSCMINALKYLVKKGVINKIFVGKAGPYKKYNYEME